MKLSLVTAMLLALSGLALADDQPADAEDRLRQLRHELGLIQTLVDEGLNLAGEDDPILRARTCNKLAGSLVQEIQKAAATKDELHAANLGHYLKDVLVRGVAGNLDSARKDIAPDSPRQAELLSVSAETVRVTQPLTEEKDQGIRHVRLMQPALDAVNHGRDAVQKALKGKNK